MTESKKTWVTPELLVLARSNPEEAVLMACKVYGGPGSTPDNLDDFCQNAVGGCSNCLANAAS